MKPSILALTRLTSYIVSLALLFSLIPILPTQAVSDDDSDLPDIEQMSEALDEMLEEDLTIDFDGDIDELNNLLEAFSDSFDQGEDGEIDLGIGTPSGYMPKGISSAVAMVGKKKLTNANVNLSTNNIVADFVDIFKALGGKLKKDSKTKGVVYKLNGIDKVYTSYEKQNKKRVTVDSVIDLFKVKKYFKVRQYTLDGTKADGTKVVQYERLEKLPKPKKHKYSTKTKEFMIGMGNSFTEVIESGFWVWTMRILLGFRVDKPYKPSKLESPKSYYMGRVTGDILALAVGLGETIMGAMMIATAVAGGGATTVMSGGTMVIAGVAITIAGITAGSAIAADGSLVAVNAMFAANNDLTKMKTFTKGSDNLKVADLARQVSYTHKKPERCTQFAEAFKKLLDKAGFKYDIIRIDSTYNPIESSIDGKVLAVGHRGDWSSFHYGIKVGDTIYDNIWYNGVPFKWWLENLRVGKTDVISYKIVKEIINH